MRMRLLCLALPALLLACDQGTPVFHAVLELPATPVGAAVVEVSGPGVRGVAAAGATRMYHEPLVRSSGETVPGGFRVVLVNTEPGPLVFTIQASDMRRHPEVRVVDLADVENRAMAVPAGLSMRLSR